MSVSANFVKQMIASHNLLIFSKTTCPYCNKIKALFTKLGYTPFIVEVDNRDDTAECQAALKAISGSSTVPQLYVNQKFIGGCSDATALNDKGQLVPLLKGL
eukprot:gene2912-3346_t